MDSPAVRVIVVNYNAGAQLARCLDALSRQSFADFEAIVVDNGSTDGSLEAAMPDDPRFTALRAGRNLGFAAANNRGAAGARTRWLATLNPDAFAELDWLGRLAAAAESHPGATMLASVQLVADRPDRFDGVGDCYLLWGGAAWRGGHRQPATRPFPGGECFGPCAAAALYDRAAFARAGGFDEAFFCYMEDIDLALRLRLAGGRCLLVADAVVLHVGSGVVGHLSDFAVFHGARNQLWTLVKSMPAPLLAPALAGYAALAPALLAWALARGRGGAFCRGVLQGMKGLPALWRRRRGVQATRRAGVAAIARAMAWNPLRFARRSPHIRPWR